MLSVEMQDINALLKENYSFDGFMTEGILNMPNEVRITLRRLERDAICPECGKDVRAEELIRRRVRGLDMIKPCYFEFRQARIRCECGYRGMEKVDFVNRYSRYTKRFEEYVASLSKRLKTIEVARVCGLDLKTVLSIRKEVFRN